MPGLTNMPDRLSLDLIPHPRGCLLMLTCFRTRQAQATFLLGHRIYDAGAIQGPACGVCLRRPVP